MMLTQLRIICFLMSNAIIINAENFSVSRMRKARNSNAPKTSLSDDHEMIISAAIQSLDLKLDDALTRIESNMMERFVKLDEKINMIHDKMFKENILTTSSKSSPPVEMKIEYIERDMQDIKLSLNDLIGKISEQKRNNDETYEKEDPIHVNIDDVVETMNVELITNLNEIYISIDRMDKQIQQNKNLLTQNYRELMTIKDYLYSSDTSKQQQQQQQQRKERGLDHSVLINDILRMVSDRLKTNNGKDATVFSTLPVSELSIQKVNGSSTADNANNTAGIKSIKISKLANQTSMLNATVSRLIFPSVKNKPSASDALNYKDVKGYSCFELLNDGMRQSGVYYLQIRGTTYWFMKVFCEQEIGDGGWTVIQRRDDFGVQRENFNRDWADYKNGFGNPAKEFWMGNENIYMLTNNEDYALRIELEDFEGNKRYAQYSHFKIHSEADYYKLEIDGYEGNAGDSLNDPWYGSNNSPFSTYNRDNDRSSLNCASMLKGGWWWKSCGRGLNGPSPSIDSISKGGIIWFEWNGYDYALKKAIMMMKPISKMT